MRISSVRDKTHWPPTPSAHHGSGTQLTSPGTPRAAPSPTWRSCPLRHFTQAATGGTLLSGTRLAHGRGPGTPPVRPLATRLGPRRANCFPVVQGAPGSAAPSLHEVGPSVGAPAYARLGRPLRLHLGRRDRRPRPYPAWPRVDRMWTARRRRPGSAPPLPRPFQGGSAPPTRARLGPQASLDTSFRLTWARQYHDSSIRR